MGSVPAIAGCYQVLMRFHDFSFFMNHENLGNMKISGLISRNALDIRCSFFD